MSDWLTPNPPDIDTPLASIRKKHEKGNQIHE